MQQRRRPRHHRRRHRGAASQAVEPSREAAQDGDPRRSEQHRPGAVAGEDRQLVVRVGGRHRDDVRLWIRGGILRADIVVVRGVAGRHDEQRPRRPRPRDGVLHGVREGAPAPRVVHDHGVHSDRVVDGVDRLGGEAGAVLPEELHGKDRDLPVDPGDPPPVPSERPEDPGDVRAVRGVVERLVVAVGEIPPVHVVDEAVAVVVQPVARDLSRVGEDVARQVGVEEVDPGVDHGDHDLAFACGDVPGARRIDVGSGLPPRLPAVAEGPLLGEARVVRNPVRREEIVRLDVLDPGHRSQARDRFFGGQPRRQFPLLGAAPEARARRRSRLRPRQRPLGRHGARIELDQHLARSEGEAGRGRDDRRRRDDRRGGRMRGRGDLRQREGRGGEHDGGAARRANCAADLRDHREVRCHPATRGGWIMPLRRLRRGPPGPRRKRLRCISR